MSHQFLRSIEKLSAWELRHFHEFAYSPFHNKHEGLRRLLDVLMEEYPDLAGSLDAREEIWQKIHPSIPFSPQKWYDLLSRTTKLIEQFLAHQSLRDKPEAAELQLLDHWSGQLEKKAFEKSSKRLQKRLPKLSSSTALYCQFRSAEHKAMLNANIDIRNPDASLEQADQFLDAYYLHQKLRLACELLNRRRMGFSDYEGQLLAEIRHHLGHFPDLYHQYPALTAYRMLYRLLEEGEGFEALRQHLNQHAKTLHPPELRSIYEYLLNYSIRQMNLGDTAFRQISYAIYLRMLDQNLLALEGVFSESHFKNIVTLALRLRQFDWAEQFIEAHSPSLPEQLRAPVKTYNLAALAYERGQFSLAKRLLQAYRVKEAYYDIGARCILLKIYYELEETEALLSLIEAFRDYLRRKKGVSVYQKELYQNLLRHTRTMVRLREQRSLISKMRYGQRYVKFWSAVKENPKVGQRQWLLETAAQLAP